MTFGIYASRQSPLWRQRETVEEHTRILDALLQRSQKDMVAAMRTHFDNTVKDMLTFFHPKSGRLIGPK
ncbi:MAG: FCD domain-containing protein [Planctomycetaceae bacterium]|nr:FCD domain-containing protein [Planctomycetaceae bacterium]